MDSNKLYEDYFYVSENFYFHGISITQDFYDFFVEQLKEVGFKYFIDNTPIYINKKDNCDG